MNARKKARANVVRLKKAIQANRKEDREFRKLAIDIAANVRDSIEKRLKKELAQIETPKGTNLNAEGIMVAVETDLDRLEDKLFNLISTHVEQAEDFEGEEYESVEPEDGVDEDEGEDEFTDEGGSYQKLRKKMKSKKRKRRM